MKSIEEQLKILNELMPKKKTSFDSDCETQDKCFLILEWSKKNAWFDSEFILEMSKQKTYSKRQTDAVDNIYDRFLNDQRKINS